MTFNVAFARNREECLEFVNSLSFDQQKFMRIVSGKNYDFFIFYPEFTSTFPEVQQ